jgi:hypothetical protein
MKQIFTKFKTINRLLVLIMSFLTLSVSDTYSQYCAVEATNLADEYITNLSFAGINNASGSSGYSDFTGQVGTVQRTVSYPLSATIFINGSYTEFITVWVDWNQDEIFSTDERYEIGTCNTDGCVITGNISVPANAVLGNTRMRVFLRWNQHQTDPCATFTYGEVEDYTVNVQAAPSCVAPTALQTTNVTSNSASLTWTPSGNENFWTIQYGETGFTLGTGTEVGSSITTPTISNLDPQTNYSFYVRAVCAPLDSSAWAGPFNFTTPCLTANIPYIRDFNTWPPACWNLTGGTQTVSQANNNYLLANYWSWNNLFALATTEPINISQDAKVSFRWSKLYNATYPNDQLILRTRILGTTQWDTIVNLVGPQFTTPGAANTAPAPDANFILQTVNLNSSYVGQDLVFQFVFNSNFGPNLYVDDFIVEAIPFDVALNSIVNPTNPITAGAQNIEAQIENLSAVDIDSVSIGWSLNGVVQNTSTVVLNPALAPGATATVVVDNAVLGVVFSELTVFLVSANGVVDDVQTNDTISTNICGPQNGTFTVGGTNADFANFAEVANFLNCGIDGPITFNVATGTYNERILLGEVFGSSATNTITFNGIIADSVLVTSGTVQQPTVVLNGTDYVTFQNMSFEHTNTAAFSYAVQLTNAANFNTFDACKFVLPYSATASRAGIAAIASTSVTPTSTANTSATNGNNANALTITNSSFEGSHFGIVIRGTEDTQRGDTYTIQNNTFENQGYCVYTFATNNLNVSKNAITNTAVASTTFRAVYNYFGSNYSYEENEISTIYNGFEIINSQTGSLVNNMVSSNGTSTVARALTVTGSTGLNVYHNTLFSFSSQAGYFTTTTGLDIRNNIFVSENATAFQNLATATFTELDYNLVYRGSTGNEISAIVGGTTYTTLAAAQNDGLATNSISGNPLFISNDNLRSFYGQLQNNAGFPLNITEDIDGNLRSLTNPDIGASEFTPIDADLALIGVDRNNDCFTTTDDLVFTVRNETPITIDLVNNDFILYYEVSGPVNTTDSIIVNSGTISGGNATLDITATNIDMSLPGTYTVSAYLASTWDVLNFNDSTENQFEFIGAINVSATNTLVTDFTEVVGLTATSQYVNYPFVITEINQNSGANTSTVIPSYVPVGTSDYIEISGVSGSDLSGYTFEKLDANGVIGSHTFAAGSVLNAQGTLVLVTHRSGTTGSAVSLPNESYYIADNPSTNIASTTSSGNILRAPNGSIVDAVAYGPAYVFPASAGVTAADWTGNGVATNTNGNRLTGEDLNNSTNWVVPSTVNQQNPNVFNNGVPTLAVDGDFAWTNEAGDTLSASLEANVGPYLVSDTNTYYFTLVNSCGTFVDSITVVATILQTDVSVTSISANTLTCPTDSLNVFAEICNNAPVDVYNVPVQAFDGNSLYTTTVDTILAGACLNVIVASIPTANGFFTEQFIVATALTTDEDTSNDTIVSNDTIAVLPPIAAPVLISTDTVCSANDTATLVVDAAGYDVYWYADAALTNKVGDGAEFNLTNISANDTLYAVRVFKLDSSVTVDLSINWPEWASENAVEIIDDNGNSLGFITSQTTGSAPFVGTGTLELATGNYTLIAYDAAGDGWDGTNPFVTFSVNGELLTTLTLASGSQGTPVPFQVGTFCVGTDVTTVPVYYNAFDVDSVNTVEISSCTATDGEFTIFASGNDLSGNGYQYSIDGGATFQSSNTFTGLAITASGYDIVVSNGTCQVNAGNFNVGANALPLAPTTSGDQAVCFGSTVDTLFVFPNTGNTVVWYSDANLTDTLSTDEFLLAGDTVGVRTFYVTQAVAANCVSPATMVTVEVFATPSAPNAGANQVACQGDSITLTVTGDNVVWSLDANQVDTLFVGNDLLALDSIATLTYYVSVEDSNACRSLIGSVDVTYNIVPMMPEITNQQGPLCEGEDIDDYLVQFNVNDVVSQGVFNWYADSTLTTLLDTGSAFTPSNALGTTTYYVVVENLGCTSEAASTSLTINANPATPTIVATSTKYCFGADAAILSVTDNGNTMLWFNTADTTLVGQNDSLTVPATQPGTYNYTIFEQDQFGCNAFANIDITIDTLPVVSATISATTVCSNESVTLEGFGADTYTWLDANADTLGTTSPFVNTPGVDFTYTLVGTDANSCSSSTTTSVTVNAAPAISVTNDTICEGEIANITVSGNADSYLWANNFTGLSIDTLATGTFTLDVTGSALNGCSSTVTATVVVNTTPAVPTISSSAVAGVITICDGSTTVLTSSNTANNVWSPNGETTASITVSAAGVYSLIAQIGNCSVESPDTIEVIVNPLPVADFTLTQPTPQSVDLTNTSSNYNTSSWNFGDSSPLVNTTDAAHTYTANNTYTVTLTVTGDCGTDVATETVTITGVSADNKDALRGLDIYPNPSRDNVNIRLVNDQISTLNVRIFDTNGKIIFEESIRDFNGYYNHIMNFKQYATGMYFINITTDKQSINTKVVITE